jgi:hypothetical protein
VSLSAVKIGFDLPFCIPRSRGGPSRIANGVRCNSSSFHSSSVRSLHFSALAALAGSRFGNPYVAQKAARCSSHMRLNICRAKGEWSARKVLTIRIQAWERQLSSRGCMWPVGMLGVARELSS